MIIGKIEPIRIVDSRPDFDKACSEAYREAINVLGITIDGCSTKVKGFDRQLDNIIVKFVGYHHIGTAVGHVNVYKFKAWIEREE